MMTLKLFKLFGYIVCLALVGLVCVKAGFEESEGAELQATLNSKRMRMIPSRKLTWKAKKGPY